ncbi:MAG TPA: hypothetical protein DEF47_03990 [Herpetosiphon sp.]|uniref:Uncharacterized protein n=1 Tax=Herpetosiphon aurantiacus (strain ATCC 23779 / DSM 785 / 114-95) TaxID=316274 RepID=A9B0P6_HERA2|nr:hypothetical protein [Herpetosiphon sp.]ABX03766.1 hypothetical protein Haur_1118 [Herpetosiphon aurantiacus DSM 785]HBW49049.1 hypothetical protein [Herpetosiphon sp.]
MFIGMYLAIWLALAGAIWWSIRSKNSIGRMQHLLGISLIEPIITVIMLIGMYPVLLEWAWQENMISIASYQLINSNDVLNSVLATVSVGLALLPLLLLFDEQAVVRSVAWQAGLIGLFRWGCLLGLGFLLSADLHPWINTFLVVGYLIMIALTIYLLNAKLRGRLDQAGSPLPVETEQLFQGQPIVYVDPNLQPMIMIDPPKDEGK